MTDRELTNLKAALEAERLELASALGNRISELTTEDGRPELIEIQGMSDRDKALGILSRLSSTLANVECRLLAMHDDWHGIAGSI